MALIDELELKRHIKTNIFKRVYLIYGDDSYLKYHYAKAIADGAVGGILTDMNLERIDGKGLKMQQFADITEQLPLMAEKRCVVVTDYDAVSKGETEIKDFLSIISDLPQSTVVVLLMDTVEINFKKPGKWNKILKAINKVGDCVILNHKTPAELERILIKSASKRNVTLDKKTANFIISVCGRDLQTLQGELEKLCAYKKDGVILTEDVDKLSAKTVDVTKYQISKALLKCDVTETLNIINSLLDQNNHIELLSVIISTFVDIYRTKAAISAGVTPKDIAADFGYRGREFVLTNAAPFAKKMSLITLRKCLDILNDADFRLKSTSQDKKIILEQTVIMLIETMRAA